MVITTMTSWVYSVRPLDNLVSTQRHNFMLPLTVKANMNNEQSEDQLLAHIRYVVL